MGTETAPSSEGKQEKKTQEASAAWWCNFCGFTTNDQAEYLKHSCTDELARQGRKIEPTGQNECR